MKVSFDGMRRNATDNMNRLQDIIDDIVRDGEINNEQIDELQERFNDSAMSVDMFNCLFDDGVEDDMNDLTDSLSINRFYI